MKLPIVVLIIHLNAPLTKEAELPPEMALVEVLSIVKVFAPGTIYPPFNVTIPDEPIVTLPDNVLFPLPDLVKLLYVPWTKVWFPLAAYSIVPFQISLVDNGVALVFEVRIIPLFSGVRFPLKVIVPKSNTPPFAVVKSFETIIFPHTVFVPEELLDVSL